jgi:GT2 family glycosyltransferase/glycosyltransferase involved in cell wall biosynthesis
MAVSHWSPVEPTGDYPPAAYLVGSDHPVVAIAVYNAVEDFQRCLESVLTHTPVHFDIVIIDDHGPDRRGIDWIDEIGAGAAHHISVYHRTRNGGFVAACNDAFALSARRDVIIVNSDVIVGAEWAQRLTDAARSSSLIATATALTNHGTIVSVPERNCPVADLPAGRSLQWCAQRIIDSSLRLRPELPTAIGHCMFVKRAALDLVGGFDESFGRGYGEEVDFSQRAVAMGFRHVCADDVFVYHRGGSSFGARASAQQQANEEIIDGRYHWYHSWVARAATDRHSPLAHALERAAVALRGVRIGFDATGLGHQITGTARVTLETAVSLAEIIAQRRDGRDAPDDRLLVFHRPELPAWMRERIATSGAELVEVTDYPTPLDTELADVVYRATQVVEVDDLVWLNSAGRRVVVGQLDLIAHRNPSYFVSDSDWVSARRITDLALSVSDGVAFISEFGRTETLAAGSLGVDTVTAVVYTGTDAPQLPSTPAVAESARPPALSDTERPFIICLGAGYRHKNRVFAIEVLGELRRRGWDGILVLAGPLPPGGGSADAEAATIERLALTDNVIDIGPVSEAERLWLLSSAALSLYPTVSEGFGLIPFESAALATPTLSSLQGSLAEVLPDGLTTMDGFDLNAWADEAWLLIHDDGASRDNVEAITRQNGFTWARSARLALNLIDEVLRRPRHRTTAIWSDGCVVAALAPAASRGVEQPQSIRVARLERMIAGLAQRAPIKRVVAPEGSRRQAMVRRQANWLRRQQQRHRHTR